MKCMGWMHEQCLVDDALRATYNRFSAGILDLPLESVNNNTDGARAVSVPYSTASGQESGEPQKKTSQAKETDPKLWVGLFEVSLNAEREGPPTMEFKDLRKDASGGKTWTEPVNCLLCRTTVS